MNKKAISKKLTSEDKTLINHSVLKRYKNGDSVEILRGKHKNKKVTITFMYYKGGSEWANLEVVDGKGKTFTIDAIDVFRYEKLKKVQ